MPQQSLATRVGILEEKVASLEGLPERMERVELQIVQLRDDMRSEFAAIRTEFLGGIDEQGKVLRGEMRELGDTLRGEMRELGDSLRGEMRELGDTLRGEMRELRDTLRGEMGELGDTLRKEMREGDEETRRYMRVLHEDLVSRIATLGESRSPGRKRR